MSLAAKFLALLLLSAGIATAQGVAQKISQLDSPAQASALGADLLTQARAPADAAAKIWKSRDGAARYNARLVLNEMAETALDPLLNSDGDLDAAEQAWRLTMVIETIDDLQRSAAKMLDQQLANKHKLPLQSRPGAEEKTPPRRVCDVAYELMSRFGADPRSTDYVLRMREFSEMSETARDAEIKRARQSGAWRALLR